MIKKEPIIPAEELASVEECRKVEEGKTMKFWSHGGCKGTMAITKAERSDVKKYEKFLNHVNTCGGIEDPKACKVMMVGGSPCAWEPGQCRQSFW